MRTREEEEEGPIPEAEGAGILGYYGALFLGDGGLGGGGGGSGVTGNKAR